jgi:hypothetical protein
MELAAAIIYRLSAVSSTPLYNAWQMIHEFA